MAITTCTVNGCESNTIARGYCSKHYQRWAKHGDPLAGNKSPAVLKAEDHADGTRTCTQCAHRKPLDEYDKDKSASLGRRSKCKACRSAMMKQWYADNQNRQMQRARDRFKRDLEKIRVNDNARYLRHRAARIARATTAFHERRARILALPYERGISVPALRARHGDSCHYCKASLVFGNFAPGQRPGTMATIEHVQPISRGGSHTWNNCVLACWRCNISRGNREWQPDERQAERSAATD